MRKTRKQEGVALVITLIVLLALSALVASMIFVTNTEVWSTANYKLLTQARYTAEAGAQATENWLINGYVAPASFASYNTNASPVTYNGTPVILSAVPGVATNYPDAAVAAAYTAALGNQSLTGVPNGTYSTYATLIAMTPGSSVSWLSGSTGGVMQTWQITSQGAIGGVRNAKVQVVETISRGGSPLFSYGLEATANGCGAMTFTGGDSTDSYNSSLGVYGGANVGTQGNIATNGNVNLGGGGGGGGGGGHGGGGGGGGAPQINGSIHAGNGTVGACPGSGLTDPGYPKNVTGGLFAQNPPLNPPLPWGCAAQPCYPPGVPPLITTAQNVSSGCASIAGCASKGSTSLYDGGSSTTANVFSLAPGSYGNININGADVVHVSAGTYNINSINFQQDGQFVVDSGPVVFNIVGNCASGCPSEGLPSPMSSTEVVAGAGYAGFNGCAGGVTANPNVYGQTTCGPTKAPFSGIPANLQMVYGGTYSIRLGGMPNALVLYAPSAGYYTPGAPVGLYGSAIIGNFNDQSGSPFHYDTALSSNLTQVGPYHVVGFSWSKF